MKNLKTFKNDTEYFADYKFATNSGLKSFKYCPYMYMMMKKGKFIPLPKTYFDFGSAVDAILSKQKIEDLFVLGGTKPRKTKEEAITKLKEVEDEIASREGAGKAPTKKMMDDIITCKKAIKYWDDTKNKRALTTSIYEHVKDVVSEMQNAPLYVPFKDNATQEIIAVEINGHKVKGKLDKLDLKEKIICDDKTTANLETLDPSIFLQQLAWYRMLVRIRYDVVCDTYAAVGDKYKAEGRKSRSRMFYAPPYLLDSQEELNLKELEVFKAEKDFLPCVDLVASHKREDEREVKCFKCDFYTQCPHSIQAKYVTIV